MTWNLNLFVLINGLWFTKKHHSFLLSLFLYGVLFIDLSPIIVCYARQYICVSPQKLPDICQTTTTLIGELSTSWFSTTRPLTSCSKVSSPVGLIRVGVILCRGRVSPRGRVGIGVGHTSTLPPYLIFYSMLF